MPVDIPVLIPIFFEIGVKVDLRAQVEADQWAFLGGGTAVAHREVAVLGGAKLCCQEDVFVELHLVADLGLVLETGQYFEVGWLVAQCESDRGIIFLIFELFTVAQVTIGYFVPQYYVLLEFDAALEVTATPAYLNIEEEVLEGRLEVIAAHKDFTA